MWILSNFDIFIFIIVLALCIIPTLKACVLLYSLIDLIIKTKNDLNRWKSGIVTLDDLQHLTPREFQYWCGDFIQKLGYTNITHSKLQSNDIKDITCKKYGETAYIQCLGVLNSPNSKYKVDDKACKKLIGAMVHDGVKRGMIITSGIITNKAVKYVNTLPKEYEIELLDGSDIICQYSFFRERKYRTI